MNEVTIQGNVNCWVTRTGCASFGAHFAPWELSLISRSTRSLPFPSSRELSQRNSGDVRSDRKPTARAKRVTCSLRPIYGRVDASVVNCELWSHSELRYVVEVRDYALHSDFERS